jgi:hypothetical protein
MKRVLTANGRLLLLLIAISYTLKEATLSSVWRKEQL